MKSAGSYLVTFVKKIFRLHQILWKYGNMKPRHVMFYPTPSNNNFLFILPTV